MARDLRIVTASLTDVGVTRVENQDFWGEFERRGERLLIVADGMGGHKGGATASRLCVESVARVFKEGKGKPQTRLRRGLELANKEVYAAALKNPQLRGMGTTAVALVVTPQGRAWVGWIGDSRAYRRRGGSLELLTADHSLVAEWIRSGILSEAEGENHPRRNELTRAIGSAESVEPDMVQVDLEPGDVLMLCSDGLWGVVPTAKVGYVLHTQHPGSAVRTLVDAANDEGGPDNVTVQILSYAEEEDPRPEAGTDPGLPAAKAEELELPAARRQGFHAPSVFLSASLAVLVVSIGLGLFWLREPRDGAPPSEPTPPPAREAGPVLRPGAAAMAEAEALRRLEGVLAGGVVLLESMAEPGTTGPETAAPEPKARLAPRPRARRAPQPQTPVPQATETPATEPQPAQPGDVIDGESPPREEFVPASPTGPILSDAEIPSADGFGLAPGVWRFVNRWLEAISTADFSLYRDLGFRETAPQFYRTYGTRDGFRLIDAEVVDVATRAPVRIYLRLVLSYVFEDGTGRFRTEDTHRIILEERAGNLVFAGSWQ